MDTIKIQMISGPMQVEATVCGAWAVHRPLARPRNRWVITQVRSGRCLGLVGVDLLSKAECVSIAKALDEKYGDRSIDEKIGRQVGRFAKRLIERALEAHQ